MDVCLKLYIIYNILHVRFTLYMYRVCQKKKDILSIHVKSEGIIIFFTKIGLDRYYHICGQMLKIHLYSRIIHEIALFQTLKRNYAVNGHEMYCTCVLFYLRFTHILTRTVTELPTVKGIMTKCNGVYTIILLHSI